jgi:hypothetical protein
MKSVWWVGVSLAFALTAAACNNGSDSSTTTPTVPLTSETLTGTVNPPVANVLQAASNPFTVASPGGTVSVTLTSAVQTNPDGTTNPSVVMGIAVGTQTGTTCALGSGNTPQLLQASATSTISGTLAAGAYCVQVSDVTNQKGPVAYTLVVLHP